jgi:hypothetical protein
LAPPKKTQEELYRLAARLFLDRIVDTTTSQGRLLNQMARKIEGTNEEAVLRATERLRKALHRGTAEPGRIAQLWSGVAERCSHPEGHQQHLGLTSEQTREVLARLRNELTAGDPLLTEFNARLDAVRDADLNSKAALLQQAAAALTRLQPKQPKDMTRVTDVKRGELRTAAARVRRGWGAVFDAAIGEGRSIPPQLLAVAETAVRGGLAAEQLERAAQRGLHFGRSGWQTPRSVVHHIRSPWIAAVAVLLVLQGVEPDTLLEETATWLREQVGMPAQTLPVGEVLTQAAATLMDAGRRGAAQQALEALWETDDTQSVWETALDLAITLAAQAYSHGEFAVAAAILDGPVRDELDSDYPGDPDEGWGASVDYRLYLLVCRALLDPYDAVGPLRLQWAAEVGREAYMPRAWWLTGMLVQVLQQIGEPAQAATVARLGPRAVEATRTPAVGALLARLSEMSSSDAPGPDLGNAERIAALTSELLALTLKDPKAADFTDLRAIEGVVTTLRLASREPRIRAR